MILFLQPSMIGLLAAGIRQPGRLPYNCDSHTGRSGTWVFQVALCAVRMLHIANACVSLLLVGCTTTEKAPLFSTGYTETRLAPDVFVIRHTGGTREHPEIADGLMLRAAQVTQQVGAKYFAIVGVDEEPGKVPAATLSMTSSSVYGIYGVGGSGRGTSMTAPKPVKTPLLTIRIFQQMPADLIVSNAANVEQAIKAKYNLLQPAEIVRGS
jgi:hypothetical protein